ncbi:sensor histidine kinase [Mycobacterium sp. BMJ-28]
MRSAVPEFVRVRLRRRGELIPLGFNWGFVITTDVAMVLIVLGATVQRPHTDHLVAVPVAIAVALSPLVLFFCTGMGFSPPLMWATWSAAGAIMLFATSTPIPYDFAPLLMVLMVGAVTASASLRTGLLATASTMAILLIAGALHRLDGVGLYVCILGMGWLCGYLMHLQQQLHAEQHAAQDALAEHAAADERRRIAREVHDVIAHSLSVTLLHLTGARRALQQDRDIDDAVDALTDAEKLGREAMADIRRTVGLLDEAPMKTAPEPGVDDIARLIDDYTGAGLNVILRTQGSIDRVSAGTGLALYRIAQESLANVAKHAPDSKSSVTLTTTHDHADLSIVNESPVAVAARTPPVTVGRGVRGMRQRVELLGGVIDIGPTSRGWCVQARIPLHDDTNRKWCGS